MKTILVAFLLVHLSIFLANGQDPPPVDAAPAGGAEGGGDALGEASITSVAPDVEADKNTICEAVKAADADMKVDIAGIMDYDDLLKLTVWNHKYDLRDGMKQFAFPPEVNWKREILTKLVGMFSVSCPEDYVPPAFLSVTKELFMIYLNSVNTSEDHSAAWGAFTNVLDVCHGKTNKFDMTTSGLYVTGVKLKSKDGNEENVDIRNPLELADNSEDLDIIIDTIYHIFSFSFGNCFWIPDHPTIYASLYKRLFYVDFLNDFKDRWMHAGDKTDFGVIYGDMFLAPILRNVRSCVTAAYLKNGIADRQLVRSIMVADPNVGMEARLNRKTGVFM